jgi:ABC-type multidrug transport system ATPase subunit
MSGQRPAPTEVAVPTLTLEFQGQQRSFQLVGDFLTLGRNPSCQLVVPPDWQVVSAGQAVLQREGIDYRIYEGDGQGQPSTNGLWRNQVRIPLQEGMLLQDGIQLTIGGELQNQVSVRYANPFSQRAAAKTALPDVISLKNISPKDTIAIGRDEASPLCLPSPLVSRRHAVIEPVAQGHQVRDLNSTNGVFVNGRRVQQAVLQAGDRLQIGSFTLIYRDDSLRLINRSGSLRLDAVHLTRRVKAQHQPRCILDDVTLAIAPGQLVALVGGSGAGKSTLMRMLLGLDAPTEGVVLVNGNPLRANYGLYRTQIGYVPQDDIVHQDLTVIEVLTFAARLRLSADLHPQEVQQTIAQTLREIEMTQYAENQVSTLSGGQRKRVSIGVELLANPKLFLLDEPTSGLDPGLDKKMMLLLRKLADGGRTIVLVTHATANIRLCDRVAFLGGGRLCYYGSPQDAAAFFGLPQGDFADIYNTLEGGFDVTSHWQQQFRQSPDYQTFVTQSLLPDAAAVSTAAAVPGSTTSPFSLRQFGILTQRYLKLVGRDRLNLALALLTAPVGIALMALTVGRTALTGNPPPAAPLALQVLFIFTCAAIWVGLSSSLQEIVRETPIYLRERLVNLRLLPYLLSKVTILAGLAVLQTGLMLGVILGGFAQPESPIALSGGTLPWAIGTAITTFLTLLASVSLGLAVSAFVSNAAQANSALPLLLLPQIILSGVLFNLSGLAKIGSWLMLSRWSVGAYAALSNVNALGWTPGIATKAAYAATPGNLLLNWGLLTAHTLLALAIALLLQKRKDPIA